MLGTFLFLVIVQPGNLVQVSGHFIIVSKLGKSKRRYFIRIWLFILYKDRIYLTRVFRATGQGAKQIGLSNYF